MSDEHSIRGIGRVGRGNSSARFARSVVLWIAAPCAIVGTLLTACTAGTPGGIGPTWGEPERATVIADWDDVDVSVETGAGQAEMAVVSRESADERERVYSLRTARDEPARLVVRRTLGSGGEPAPGAAAPAKTSRRAASPEPLQLEARVGLFGNADAEKRLLAAVRLRLGDLAGVDFAPIRSTHGP